MIAVSKAWASTQNIQKSTTKFGWQQAIQFWDQIQVHMREFYNGQKYTIKYYVEENHNGIDTETYCRMLCRLRQWANHVWPI